MNPCPPNPSPEHIASCEECSVAAVVAPWMKRFASLNERQHILPHPSIVWLKAQVLRSSSEAARASRPMTYVQFFAYGLVASGWAALLTWKWEAIQELLRPFNATNIASGSFSVSSVPMFGALMLLATVTVTLALHTILAEE